MEDGIVFGTIFTQKKKDGDLIIRRWAATSSKKGEILRSFDFEEQITSTHLRGNRLSSRKSALVFFGAKLSRRSLWAQWCSPPCRAPPSLDPPVICQSFRFDGFQIAHCQISSKNYDPLCSHSKIENLIFLRA